MTLEKKLQERDNLDFLLQFADESESDKKFAIRHDELDYEIQKELMR